MVAKNTQVSIIIPTYNESQNILTVLKSVRDNLPKNLTAQTIVVDDNSPDGTGRIVEDYLKTVKEIANYTIDVIHRTAKRGLSSAILNGIQHATGDTIVVMDSDLSHPPHVIPRLIEALKQYQCDLVVASRYIKGGKIHGWGLKRKVMSKLATVIAKKGLGVKPKDPMSGFFVFRKNILREINFDAIGYKILLEILVKKDGLNVREIPYTFEDRTMGSSKLTFSVVSDYVKSVWKLYKFGKTVEKDYKSNSVKFFSKAARFYTVGATGFGVNYLISLLFAGGFSEMWYLHANLAGIIASITTNFLLNKAWTFGDRDFSLSKTIKQYGKFILFSSFGALIQLGMVYYLVDQHGMSYPVSLVLAVLSAAAGNFILNKKLTFKEKIWT